MKFFHFLQIFFISLTFNFFPYFARGENTSFQELLHQADQAYEAKSYEEAFGLYEKASQTNSQNYELIWKWARVCVHLSEQTQDEKSQEGYEKKAYELGQKAIGLNPDGTEGHLYFCLGLGKWALGKGPREQIRVSKEIKEHIEKSIALDPSHHSAWHVLGCWHQRLATLNWFEKSCANLFLGGVPKDASLEKAVECFQKAIALEPNAIFHHLELAKTYEAMKKKEDAIQEYQKVLALPIYDSEDNQRKKEAEKRMTHFQFQMSNE
ncbi:MAG: hypothetical protein HYS08_08725 [Chlamydiae bacterium]|nr:hypothetical protein [Chlamydiota bacterium]MBI3265446.1 hypothetical protein [Chlamydiota bacterium]